MKTDDYMQGDSERPPGIKPIHEARAALDKWQAEHLDPEGNLILSKADQADLMLELQFDLISLEVLGPKLFKEPSLAQLRAIKAQAEEIIKLATEIEGRGFLE